MTTEDEAALAALLPDPFDPADLEAPAAQAWRIEDNMAAEWAMRHVAAANDTLAAIRAEVQVWKDRVAVYEATRTAEPLRTKEFFEGLLRDWGRRWRLQIEALPASQRKRMPKTLPLVTGALPTTFREGRDEKRVQIDDMDAVARWCMANGHADIVRHSVSVTDLREFVGWKDLAPDGEPAVFVAASYETGEVVPGCRVEWIRTDPEVTVKVEPA